VRWGFLPSFPLMGVRLPSVPPPTIQVWDETHIAQFWAVAQGDRYGAVYWLALTTGMRQGEILGLHWTDWEADRLVVRRTLVWDGGRRQWVADVPKTARSQRVVWIGTETQQVLARHRQLCPPVPGSPWMFQTRTGKPVSARNLMRTFYRLMKQAAVPRIRFHDLRHTHASWLLRQGASPRMVADRLGHAQVNFTLNTYTHFTVADQQPWVEVLEQRVQAEGPKRQTGPEGDPLVDPHTQ
jgi:integrase